MEKTKQFEFTFDEVETIKQALQEYAENCEQDSECFKEAEFAWKILKSIEEI